MSYAIYKPANGKTKIIKKNVMLHIAYILR
jgi:hypothetical protein